MLEGYELHPLGVFDSENFSCEYKSLVEMKTKKEKAVLITISKKKEKDDKVRNLCLPINNEVLFKKFMKNRDNLGLTIGAVFDYTGVSMLSAYIQKQYNSSNTKIKTTEKEYLFLTETDVSENNEILDGYELKPFVEETIEEKYNYNYKLLVDSKTQSVKAVSIKITKLKKDDNRVKYLCMPLNNRELGLKFEESSIKSGVNMSYFLDASIFSLVSKIVDNRYNAK
jgi:hypothetical protein